MIPRERTCRDCGCTDFHACQMPDGGACWWVERDLCSACVTIPINLVRQRHQRPALTKLKTLVDGALFLLLIVGILGAAFFIDAVFIQEVPQ